MLKRQVEGIGPLNATIMIIGEALGADEVIKKEPFVGWSGQFLREMCERAGLSWPNIHVDNVVQYQPDRNDFSRFYNDKSQREPTEELQAWWTDLHRRIETIKPKVIIAAGDQPLFALTGHKGSTSWRGSVIQTTVGAHECFVVPIVHPSYSRRCYNMTSSKMKDPRQPWFHISVFDLIKAKKVSEEGWAPKDRTEKIFPTYTEVMDYLNELKSMPSETSITIDIETLRREHVKCIGLTHRDDYAMCIPFVANTSGQSYYPLNQEAEIWRELDHVLNTHFVNGQTVGFDCSYLDRDIGLWFTDNLYIDTAILHSLLYPELKHDLGFLASMYTDMSYFKYLGRGNEAKTNVAQTYSYNCQDVMSTHEIAMALKAEAIESGMWDYYFKKRLPLAKWAIRQHRKGISIDESRRNEIIQRVYYEDIKPKHDIFNEALKECGYPLGQLTKTYIDKFEGLNLEYNIDETFNVKSPQQVIGLLRSLGYNVKDSSEETLSLIANESIVAKTIMDLRSDYSLLSAISRPTDGDNKFRTSINLHVTETTRLSSTKSHFGSGCLLPTTEVLTPMGWKSFCLLSDEVEALVWNPKIDCFKFEQCKVVTFPFDGLLESVNSNCHTNLYTPTHRVPTYTTRLNNLTVYEAQDVAKRMSLRLPVSSTYISGTTRLPFTRLLVAAMADGDISSNTNLRFSFKKELKIERLYLLAELYECSIKETSKVRSDLRRFSITGYAAQEVLNYCHMFDKHFQPNITSLSYETLLEIIDELKYWDSHIRDRSYIFTTVRDELAHQVALIAHLTRNSASISINDDNNRGYGSGNNKPLYLVNIKPRWYVDSNKTQWTKVPYKGDVSCLSTSTGFFLTRYNSNIIITGNSNIQNVTRKARPLFCGDYE